MKKPVTRNSAEDYRERLFEYAIKANTKKLERDFLTITDDIKSGAYKNINLPDAPTLMHAAAVLGFTAVGEIFKRNYSNQQLNMTTTNGLSPLCVSMVRRNTKFSCWLLDNKIGAHADVWAYNLNPLIYACWMRDFPVIGKLISLGASAHPSAKGYTPLYVLLSDSAHIQTPQETQGLLWLETTVNPRRSDFDMDAAATSLFLRTLTEPNNMRATLRLIVHYGDNSAFIRLMLLYRSNVTQKLNADFEGLLAESGLTIDSVLAGPVTPVHEQPTHHRPSRLSASSLTEETGSVVTFPSSRSAQSVPGLRRGRQQPVRERAMRGPSNPEAYSSAFSDGVRLGASLSAQSVVYQPQPQPQPQSNPHYMHPYAMLPPAGGSVAMDNPQVFTMPGYLPGYFPGYSVFSPNTFAPGPMYAYASPLTPNGPLHFYGAVLPHAVRVEPEPAVEHLANPNVSNPLVWQDTGVSEPTVQPAITPSAVHVQPVSTVMAAGHRVVRYTHDAQVDHYSKAAAAATNQPVALPPPDVRYISNVSVPIDYHKNGKTAGTVRHTMGRTAGSFQEALFEAAKSGDVKKVNSMLDKLDAGLKVVACNETGYFADPTLLHAALMKSRL
ncbi:MAG: hypothetical protein V4490_01375, partial [Pseudomonadota bacterium]